MGVHKKPLPVEEQTMLLVTLLFARKHLDEVLSFLPAPQSERMHEAKNRFLKLEQGERITQIILELRRLWLIKEHNIRWIHPSWIDEELSKEPAYLRPILQQALSEKTKKTSDEPEFLATKSMYREQIVQSFLLSFVKTPQKIAIFDPVLMRLQSLNRTNQDQTICAIGQLSISTLSHAIHKTRFVKFLERNFHHDIAINFDQPIPDDNPFSWEAYKKILLRIVFEHRNQPLSHLCIDCGLMVMAMYLRPEKPRWHRMIELVLARRYGVKLRSMIDNLETQSQDLPEERSLSGLLIDSMAGAFS